MEHLLSIIIVEYNSVDDINHCINALSEHIGIPFEIIVSSNSCYDTDKQKTLCQQSKAQWIFNQRNGGFAYAMNQGLKVAKGDFLVIMNSDCILESDLAKMVSFMNEHKEIGAIGPMIKDSKGNIQDTARPYVSVQRYILRQIRRILEHQVSILENKMDYSKIQTVDWIIGAFIMVTRKAYEATNGLDEHFFMYAEDLDWCSRIRKAGYEIVYYPQALISYKGSRRARSNKAYAKIFIKSHIRYWKKFGFFFGYPRRVIKYYK